MAISPNQTGDDVITLHEYDGMGCWKFEIRLEALDVNPIYRGPSSISDGGRIMIINEDDVRRAIRSVVTEDTENAPIAVIIYAIFLAENVYDHI